MKKWMLILLVFGVVLLFASFFIYTVRIGYCYLPTLPEKSVEGMAQFREECSLDSARVVQFSGFLMFFIPGIILFTAYWLMRPPKTQVQREGPLASFLLLTIFDSLLLAVLAFLSYPEAGHGNAKVAMLMACFGLAGYISLLGIWQWKRWGLLLFQVVTVMLTIYAGASGLTMLPAAVAIFSVFYLTLILRPLRKFMT